MLKWLSDWWTGLMWRVYEHRVTDRKLRRLMLDNVITPREAYLAQRAR